MSEEWGRTLGRVAVVRRAVGARTPSPEEGLRLLEAFQAISCATTRARVVHMVEAMSRKVTVAGSA